MKYDKKYTKAMNSLTVSSRDISRNYQQVFKQVQRSQRPAVVMNRQQPQVVIISLEEYELFQQLEKAASGQRLGQAVQQARSLIKDQQLPADLASNHNKYAW